MKFLDWGKIVSFITYEWGKKLIALGIALFLWYYVNTLSYIEQTFTLPIQFTNLPEDLVMVESSDSTATFTVKGRIEMLKNINPSKMMKPVVNLENALPGVKNYKIEIVINEPQADLIINLLKERVNVKIDKIENKTVLVQPIVTGNPKDGFIVDDVIMDKNIMNIRGPSEIISQQTYLETKPVLISGASNDVEQTVNVSLPKFVSVIGYDKITIKVRIIPKEMRKDSN